MLQLKADGWFDIKGRGKLATFDRLPEEFYEDYYEPHQLINQHVKIDGLVYTVVGVERFAIGPCSPENPYRLACGLLVKESLSPSPYYRPNMLRRDYRTDSYRREIKESRDRSPKRPESVTDNNSTSPSAS